MKLNSTVLLSISDYRTRFAGTRFSCVLFGSEGEATYCNLLGTEPDQIEVQINEYFELAQIIEPSIELLGLAFVGHGLNPAALHDSFLETMGVGTYILLVDLDDSEQAVCRAFHKCPIDSDAGTKWKPTSLQLVADQAVATAVADSIKLDSTSNVHRAKCQFKNKVQQLRTNLENVENNNDASALIAQYGQLKKMHFKKLSGGDVDPKDESTVLYELLAEIVAKSDERHRHFMASAFNRESSFL